MLNSRDNKFEYKKSTKGITENKKTIIMKIKQQISKQPTYKRAIGTKPILWVIENLFSPQDEFLDKINGTVKKNDKGDKIFV